MQRQVGAQSSQDTLYPTGLMIGTGVRTVATEKLFSQGGLSQTENPLDAQITAQETEYLLTAYNRSFKKPINADDIERFERPMGVGVLAHADGSANGRLPG